MQQENDFRKYIDQLNETYKDFHPFINNSKYKDKESIKGNDKEHINYRY